METIRNNLVARFGTLALPDLETLNWDASTILPAWVWTTNYVYDSPCVVFADSKETVRRILERDVDGLNRDIADWTDSDDYFLTPALLRVYDVRDAEGVAEAVKERASFSVAVVGLGAEARARIVDLFGEAPDRTFYSPMIA
jgi:hypothetical protein